MKTMTRICAISVVAVLTACSAGTNFVRPSDDKIQLGKTTKTEIISSMGTPYSKGELQKNGVNVEFVKYAYGDPSGTPLVEGVTPAKNISMYFANGTLVGTDYTSSFKEGNSSFDTEKAKTIKDGMTEAEVIGLLGKPGGEYRYPMLDDKDGHTLVYVYNQMKGRNLKNNVLKVDIDSAGVVRKVEFTQSGI